MRQSQTFKLIDFRTLLYSTANQVFEQGHFASCSPKRAKLLT